MKLALFRTAAFLAAASVTASAAAQHPRLLKRHGFVYGVRGIAYYSSCKGITVFDECETYTLSGTITRVDYSPLTHRREGFMLRVTNGGTKLQNFEIILPPTAENLIRPGRRVRVTGIMTGRGRVAVPNEIIALRGRQVFRSLSMGTRCSQQPRERGRWL
jgi:hypothetical protein